MPLLHQSAVPRDVRTLAAAAAASTPGLDLPRWRRLQARLTESSLPLDSVPLEDLVTVARRLAGHVNVLGELDLPTAGELVWLVWAARFLFGAGLDAAPMVSPQQPLLCRLEELRQAIYAAEDALSELPPVMQVRAAVLACGLVAGNGVPLVAEPLIGEGAA